MVNYKFSRCPILDGLDGKMLQEILPVGKVQLELYFDCSGIRTVIAAAVTSVL